MGFPARIIMTQYELINPSDPYTFMAKNREVAALVVFSLSTAYGAESEDYKENIPIFLFGGAKEWYQEEFGRSPDDGLKAERIPVSEALLSFVYGHFEDRRRYEAALEAITDPDKKKKFIDEWQDGHTSMNDIGTYAHRLGEKLMASDQEPVTGEK